MLRGSFLTFKDMLSETDAPPPGCRHQQDGLGIANVIVAVRHRAIAPGIGDAGDRGEWQIRA